MVSIPTILVFPQTVCTVCSQYDNAFNDRLEFCSTMRQNWMQHQNFVRNLNHFNVKQPYNQDIVK